MRAAQIGYVLGKAYERMRGAAVADHKNLLELALAAARGPHVDLTIELPGGVRIVTDGSERENGEARALAMDLERQRLSASQEPVTVATSNPDDMLSVRIDRFIEHMDAQNRSKKNLLDTEHTLRLFLALQGDKMVQAYAADDIDAFMGAMRVWPANASKKPGYRDLSPLEVVTKAKREGSPRTCAPHAGKTPRPPAVVLRRVGQAPTDSLQSLRRVPGNEQGPGRDPDPGAVLGQ
ncbi:hypothetical protein P3W24_12315 [Luteibacter sp. PPL201]|uniref:Integrase n=1 Tax=Luteibacter sahnii TaxID=3021977 RepID=A0ABT6BEY7_9GAMM